MNNNEILNFLEKSGVNKLVGVIGSGDSLEIATSFTTNGGQLIVLPTEFSAPIVASAINKESMFGNYAASISIRGPGLISSTPGIYYNLIEDLTSLSISEGLNKTQSQDTNHKYLNYKQILSGVGLKERRNMHLKYKFELGSLSGDEENIMHTITQSHNIFTHKKSKNEMMSDQSNSFYLKKRRKIFIIGKRAFEQPKIMSFLETGVPFFLTPAALPFVNLNMPNYLGVWTGNEQLKYLNQIFNQLKNVIIIRLGVMKRELLTFKEVLPHFDIPLYSSKTKLNLDQFIEIYGTNTLGEEKQLIYNLRNTLTKNESSWSVFSVVKFLNSIKADVNYVFDVGDFATVIENYLKPIYPQRIHSTFIGKFMGTAISIATGIGIAKPEIPQICFLGEGSFSASYHDIASIINLKLPICIMVFSDDSMHSVTRTNKKLIDTGNFLPINFKTLEKSLIFDSPIHYIFSLEELSNIFQSWQKTKPLILILKFENKNYARLVECLR